MDECENDATSQEIEAIMQQPVISLPPDCVGCIHGCNQDGMKMEIKGRCPPSMTAHLPLARVTTKIPNEEVAAASLALFGVADAHDLPMRTYTHLVELLNEWRLLSIENHSMIK